VLNFIQVLFLHFSFCGVRLCCCMFSMHVYTSSSIDLEYGNELLRGEMVNATSNIEVQMREMGKKGADMDSAVISPPNIDF